MKDCRGRDVTIGSVIVYPGRASSSLWLNSARVVGIDNTRHPWRAGADGANQMITKLRVRREKDNKLVTVTETWRIAVVA